MGIGPASGKGFLKTATSRYTLYGAAFGFCFPIIATLLEAYLKFNRIGFDTILSSQRESILLWIIDSAPLFLGIFARFGGRHLDQVNLQQNLLKERFDEMSVLRSKAEAASHAKSEFLANMSHEIRTPMNAIIGLHYLLNKSALDANQQQYVTKADQSAKNLLRIIDDILDFSKIEAGKLTLEETRLSLEEVISDVAGTVNVKLGKKENVELVTSLDPALPQIIMGDGLRLRQVFLNLLDNAAKFTDAGEIKLVARLLQHTDKKFEVEFRVRDSGIGMTKEQAASLFRPFQQADLSTTRKFGGTGLGLAICKSIVEMMGGRISVVSEKGAGSEFIFTVWFREATEQVQTTMQSDGSMKGQRVLLVDDSETARQVIAEMLTSFGLVVLQASDAQAAIKIYESGHSPQAPISLLVVDWRMPGMDGLQLVQLLRNKYGSNVPNILMVTAFGVESIRDAAAEHLIDSYLTKPISPSSLFDKLNELFYEKTIRPATPPDGNKALDAFRSQLNGAHVLLVEDNEINLEIAMELLRDVGITFDVAGNGAEAIEKVKAGNHHLVLMDIQMPVMDGLTATRNIRKDSKFDDMPIVAMTAHALKEDYQKSMDAGMNDHITKPIDPMLLYRTLVRFLPTSRKTESTATVSDPSRPVPTEQQIPEIPGINVTQGLARMRNNIPAYRKILVRFAETHQYSGKQLDEALSSGNFDELHRILHTAAGVTGNIGAEQTYSLLNRLSSELRQDLQNSNFSRNPGWTEKVKQAGAALSQLSSAILERIQNVSEHHDEPIDDPARVSALITDLKSLISNSDMAAVETCRQIRITYRLTEEQAMILKRVAKALDDFDFDQAKDCLAEVD